MELTSTQDTIVACATPPGEGALAVVRISGPQALPIARALQRRAADSAPPPRKLVLSTLWDSEHNLLDESMVVEMPGPGSYTGEDIAELHLHGAQVVVERVLDACIAAGARRAQPGEFTLRAFLNGRVSLAQAEAVADLIGARSALQSRVAAEHLRGGLSRGIESLLERMEVVLADWQAALDFPEYPTGDGLLTKHLSEVATLRERIQALISGARPELHQKRRVVLCGAPNVGKSSLLNAWAGEHRVLVDETPGTTRDPVEIQVDVGQTRVSLWDTAGIREEGDALEQRGIDMATERVRGADIALWLLDAASPSWPPPDLDVVVIGSKADAVQKGKRQFVESEAERRGLVFLGWVSAQQGEGLGRLEAWLEGETRGDIEDAEAVVVRQRHVDRLREAESALARLLDAQAAGASLDVLAFELQAAVKALGEILGRDVDVAVLDRVFKQFCIGK